MLVAKRGPDLRGQLPGEGDPVLKREIASAIGAREGAGRFALFGVDIGPQGCVQGIQNLGGLAL